MVDGLGEPDDIEILIWNEIHSRFFLPRTNLTFREKCKSSMLWTPFCRGFQKGELHHGLIFHGNSLDAIEQEALILTRNILDIDERNSEHPDLFHLRPTGKMRVITG